MTAHSLGQPMAALLVWTMVIFVWMYATRIPALLRSDIDLKTVRGTTGRTLDDRLPAEVQWKAHNYNHLLEQPLLFYAACLLLILLNAGEGLAVGLAWAYVGFRVLHSLVQTTVNIVRIRFVLFMGASLALLGLVVLTLFAAF